MDARTQRDILSQLKWLRENAVIYRRGVVTDDSPLTISLGGATETYADVKRLASYTPAVDDAVAVLTWGHDLIVLGKIV